MLIQSLHPSATSPRPTVSVVASEILRHWPLVPREWTHLAFLVSNGPTHNVPWLVFTPGNRPEWTWADGLNMSSVLYPNAEPSRHRAKRMAVQLLKALK